MEAMAVGMPVVATDAGGVGEVVTHERNGLLVPTRDAAALAGAMTRVMQDSRLRSDLGQAAAETIRDEFDQDGMIDRYVETYQAILAGECDR